MIADRFLEKQDAADAHTEAGGAGVAGVAVGTRAWKSDVASSGERRTKPFG
jgi:hypothetical protein